MALAVGLLAFLRQVFPTTPVLPLTAGLWFWYALRLRHCVKVRNLNPKYSKLKPKPGIRKDPKHFFATRNRPPPCFGRFLQVKQVKLLLPKFH